MSDPRAALERGLAGRYTVERELGRGGMATVYLAHDLKHNRQVAIKVMLPEIAAVLGNERFQREIGLAARLQHPHILSVYDSGEVDGHLWFTMPYVEGVSLSGRMKDQGRLPLAEAMAIAQETARALEYAHQHGIIHRDIKPDNILLATDGSTLVADFGIARSLKTQDIHLTQTGSSLGTPAYMSPEQASGDRDIDARTDIYSLAVVVYQMLAGELPYSGPSASAIMKKRFTEPPPKIRKLRPDVPAGVETALIKAMALEPGDRFRTVQEFAGAMRAAVEAATATAKSGWSRGMMAGVAAGVLVVIAALVWGVRARGTAGASSIDSGEPITVAVLPFVNLGDSSDAYFADGVSDEVRGRLTQIPSLAIIARSSSLGYRSSTKPMKEIAQELGVKYLLTGTVRWAKQKDGSSRVQVTPELVEIGDGTERSRWQKGFDAPLTEVFQVQGEIATKVADALNVELAANTVRHLGDQPTRDLVAYDSYLKALATFGSDLAIAERRVQLLEQAVTRDPQFGVAWGALSREYNRLSGRVTIFQQRVSYEAKRDSALKRAAALAPEAPETYVAQLSLRVNTSATEGLAIAREASRRYPNSAEIMRYLGQFETELNQTDSAVVHLEKAQRLDPRSFGIAASVAQSFASSLRPAEARKYAERALALAPGDAQATSLVVDAYMYEGDTANIMRVINAPQPNRPLTLAYMAVYGDYWWLLTPAQQDSILAAPVDIVDGDRASGAMTRTQIYHARGNLAAARSWADTAISEMTRTKNADPQLPALSAIAAAIAGRPSQAQAFLAEAVRLKASSQYLQAYVELLQARALLLMGKQDEALALMERTPVSMGGWNPHLVQLHPEFRVLRGNPRFEKLIAQK